MINSQNINLQDEQLEENTPSLKNILDTFLSVILYLKINIKIIALSGLLGLVITFFGLKLVSPKYKAKITFVVEEGKGGTSSLGNLASLAGQFGVDVPGATSSGVLSGDNILLYFKSQTIAKDVLLSKFQSGSIADFYSQIYGYKEKWSENKKIGNIDFNSKSLDLRKTELKDSLLNELAEEILSKRFLINKTDKKASFIEVTAEMRNPDLAKAYCEKIVDIAINKYLLLKTKRQKTSVDKLQKRADSLAFLLNSKTVASANLQTRSTTMDINPLYRSNSVVAFESTARDKTLIATIFASVIQNLELAKFTLSQETPMIQIIDNVQTPLKKISPNKFLYSFLGSFLAMLLSSVVLIFKKII